MLALAALAAASPVRPAPADDAAASTAALKRLTGRIGEAPCDGDDQCATLPVGAKACGGPERWLAWSRATADAATLEALAADYTALRRRWLRKSGAQSTCSIVTDRGATCVAGHCVTGSAGPRAD